ncbi:hypothetical protein ACO0M4_37165 [Streptomyces sp. RGM 3693]|uniref:hypothetical protein n=1 Tax=Streptomyces sp. RGM 3693 TaxID=3413284 RepID=UPI003D2C1383
MLFAALTVAGGLLLAYGGGAGRRGGRVPLPAPLTATWIGSGALACWGGWLALTALPLPAGDPRLPAPPMSLTYAVQMIVGMLVAVAGAHFFAERAARTTGVPGATGSTGAPGNAGATDTVGSMTGAATAGRTPGAVRCG